MMRSTLLAWALAALSATSFAATEKVEDKGIESTVFNGITVPPLPEIEGAKFEETIKSGHWWIKFYSPYCGHCKAIKQHWQTLYEFYTTSSPLEGRTEQDHPDLDSPNSFHGYYNFHFGAVNCIAYGDACDKVNIAAYPTFLLFKDGEIVEKYNKGREMEDFSAYVEEQLEKIKPGSRPSGGVKMPKPGDTSIDRSAKPDKPAAKDKDAQAGIKTGQKQNSKENATPTRPLMAWETAKLNKPKSGKGGNPDGRSIALTAESFQTSVIKTSEAWFIKFYAPWCQHCQHLAPTWTQMARDLQGKLNVGEVNCDLEPKLCKQAGVSAYPTILYIQGGERLEFEGLRGLGDLITFANKAIDSDVRYVDAEAFAELERSEEVIFTYFFDHATTSEDFAALDRLTLSLIGRAKLVKTDSEELGKRFKIHTWPRLLVVRNGHPTFFTALAPRDIRDFEKVLSWMQSVWLPIVPELTTANAREIMTGKLTVLGVLARDKPEQFVKSRNELKSAALEWMDIVTTQFQRERQELRRAKQLRVEEAEDRDDERALRQAKSRIISISEDTFRKQVSFAWVEGVFWERWLRSTYGVDIAQGERVIIADEDNRRYWDVTDTGNFITPSKTSILETLSRVASNPPKLPPKSTVGFFEGCFFRVRHMFTHHPLLSSIVLVVAAVSLFWIRRRGSPIRLSSPSGGLFNLDEKNGLLGGNSGKHE